MERFNTVVLVISGLLTLGKAAQICNVNCDGRDPSLVSEGVREAVSATINSRQIKLLISDSDNMAFATISNGQQGDEVWIDRSFDGGLSWDGDGLLGFTTIPSGSDGTTTLMYNVDNEANKGLGALRACGRGLIPSDLICTEWARSTVLASTPIEAAATALYQLYDGALFHTVGWWNGANAFTALMQYMRLTGSTPYLHIVESTFINNLEEWSGNFTSGALDDTEWWALAWVEAYDLTGNMKYLDMAIFVADFIYQYVDDVCGGGLWSGIGREYKNAITNELYIQLAAALHNRISGDTKYWGQAIEMWTWFKQSGMINENNLINDGLTNDCKNNGDVTWTYNQGVLLGALVELYLTTDDATYIDEARLIADAVVQSPRLSVDGVLTEPCEGSGPVDCGQLTGGCDCNAISFKGIFMRHLGELNRKLPTKPYQQYIAKQVESNYAFNRNALNQYGIHYAGPLEDVPNAGTHHSSFEAFIAAIDASQ